MYVRYYMATSLVSVHPETNVGTASDLLEKHDIRHLPVVDQEMKLVGMVTDRDIRSAFPSTIVESEDQQGRLDKVQKTPVSDIMSTKISVLRTVSTLDDAMLFFEKRTIGALPVLDGMGKVVGILSFNDLMRAWKSFFGLGEKGSFLVALEVESLDQSLTPLVHALEEINVPFTRLIRTDGTGREPAMIYLKVRTYNIIAVHGAIEKAGFKVFVNDDHFDES